LVLGGGFGGQKKAHQSAVSRAARPKGARGLMEDCRLTGKSSMGVSVCASVRSTRPRRLAKKGLLS